MTAALTRSLPALANGVFRYTPIVILLLLWQGATDFNWISTAVLPPLSGVAASGYELVTSAEFWDNASASLYRGGVGLLLAIVIGGGLGIAMAWWRPIRYVMSPIVEIFYPLPKSALIPVTAMWLGFGDTSKILLIFLGCMLPVTIGAFNGARGAEQALIWSARSLGASRLQTLWDVVVPSALPELLNGIRTALALSFILLVSAELIVARKGLGYMIGFLGDGGNYDAMFAVVMVVALMGLFADRIYLLVMKRALRWRE
jgi:ABC-type nitrate/sulfonate/bicarbonate transport system permease component